MDNTWKTSSAGQATMAAVAALAFVAVAIAMPAEALPSASDTQLAAGGWYAMSGDAMEPSIPAGALTLTAAADAQDVHVGDIVTLQLNGALVTRRVVASDAIDAGRLVTLQADASTAPENVGVMFTDKATVVRAYVPLAGYAVEIAPRAGRIVIALGLLALAAVARAYLRRPRMAMPEVQPATAAVL